MDAPGILLVEDELAIATMMDRRLVELGYRVVGHARTGDEAVLLAASSRPDLILMDINLSGEIDGIEAAKRIRESRQVPIVFLTGKSDGFTFRRARDAGSDGYLLKPFADAELQKSIRTALAGKPPKEAGPEPGP